MACELMSYECVRMCARVNVGVSVSGVGYVLRV